MDNKPDEVKIIDYWYLFEFLDQVPWPDEKNNGQNRNLQAKTGYTPRSLEISFRFRLGEDLLDKIDREMERHHMAVPGNVTICLGKISRQACVNAILQTMHLSDDLPEKPFGWIAMASLQIASNGSYIPKSFSISPILWAMRRLNGRAAFTSALSFEDYQSDLRDYEHRMTDSFSGRPLRTEDLSALLDELTETYLSGLAFASEREQEDSRVMLADFQAYRSSHDAESTENTEFTGLTHPFFLQDLKMVQEGLSHPSENESGMQQSLRRYILAPYREYLGQGQNTRRDILPSDKKDWAACFEGLSNILAPENAPIGKWPSRYRPALMQQYAVNTVTGSGHAPIFSVNGPPGTGKTTMLREIVASCVVQKADILVQYLTPDDLFKKKIIQALDGGPDKICYTLKDETIRKYGMLVVSSNNAAVENITKELPMEEKMQKDLAEQAEDTPSQKKYLQWERERFSARVNEAEAQKKYDVYFSSLAESLLGDSQQHAWGLVATALGKQSNVRSFSQNVLKPFLEESDLSEPENSTKQTIDAYRQARQTFKDQKYKVETIRQSICDLKQAYKDRLDKQVQFEAAQREVTLCAAQYDKQGISPEALQSLKEYRENLEDQIKKLKEEGEKFQNEKADWERTSRKIKARLNKCDRGPSIWMRILMWFGYHPKKEDKGELENKLREAERGLQECDNKLKWNNDQISDKDSQVHQLTNKIDKVEPLWSAFKNAQNECRARERELNELKQKCVELERKNPDCVPLDDEYADKLFSSDPNESTWAQTHAPWTTEVFDREREILFYDALKLTETFILASKCCRANLYLLWKFWSGTGSTDSKGNSLMMEQMAQPLFDTLFLLVPVISSTFASVGHFLAQLKSPGSIGLLLIDEAGQAQPHMALGALYRAQQAVIVGDPKQIEPVVPDEMALLKKGFRDELFQPYKDISLSVQQCADLINPIGTYFPDEIRGEKTWVGSPLVVHRRCISPMYDISNRISYGGVMKQQTRKPSREKEAGFVCDSIWFDIKGREKGCKNHDNRVQDQKAWELLKVAYEKAGKMPDLYVISPFKTVVFGFRNYIQQEIQNEKELMKKEWYGWLKDHVGTVHTFQGKEADQVIFLLGCDDSAAASGAVRWVNSNIVNVAVTRAKYRVYVIGDATAWSVNPVMKTAESYLPIQRSEKRDSQDFVVK